MENYNLSSHGNYTDCIGGSGPGDTFNLFRHLDIDTLISPFLTNMTNWVFCLTWGFCGLHLRETKRPTQMMFTCPAKIRYHLPAVLLNLMITMRGRRRKIWYHPHCYRPFCFMTRSEEAQRNVIPTTPGLTGHHLLKCTPVIPIIRTTERIILINILVLN